MDVKGVVNGCVYVGRDTPVPGVVVVVVSGLPEENIEDGPRVDWVWDGAEAGIWGWAENVEAVKGEEGCCSWGWVAENGEAPVKAAVVVVEDV